jgi:hypothetical protein
MSGTVLQGVAKTLVVSAECITAGFAIGTAAHFVGGAFGFGLSFGAFQLAAFEGGIPGAAIGLVVGLLIFYAILHCHATWKEWVVLIAVAFATAALTFLPLGVMTLMVTPIVTIAAAFALGFRQ